MSEEKLEDLRLAESGLWARRCRVQRCDREIVDGSAALGRRREGSKDAAGAASSSRRRRSRSRRRSCCSLPGLPGARPPGKPASASILAIQLAPRAGVAGKETTAFAAKHPDPGELLRGERPQLGGGGEGAGER